MNALGFRQICYGKDLSSLLGQKQLKTSTISKVGGEAAEATEKLFGIVRYWNTQWLDTSSQRRTEAKSILSDEIIYLFANGLSVYAGIFETISGESELRMEVREIKPLDKVPSYSIRRTDFDERDAELKAYFTWWDRISWHDRDALVDAIDTATRESDMQKFLEEQRHLLVQHLTSGHGRWVFSQKRLGSEYVTDFLIAARDSMGYSWTAVELESPSAKPFTQKGDQSSALVHAIRQVTDWRNWLKKNSNYAANPRADSGLGLPDIDSDLDGLVLIGRRQDFPKNMAAVRRDLKHRLGIQVRPYEWLIDNIETCLASLDVRRIPEVAEMEECSSISSLKS